MRLKTQPKNRHSRRLIEVKALNSIVVVSVVLVLVVVLVVLVAFVLIGVSLI